MASAMPFVKVVVGTEVIPVRGLELAAGRAAPGSWPVGTEVILVRGLEQAGLRLGGLQDTRVGTEVIPVRGLEPAQYRNRESATVACWNRGNPRQGAGTPRSRPPSRYRRSVGTEVI